MPLEPQAALEQAVVNAILSGNLGYQPPQCARTFDGQPPPKCGIPFVAVWWDGSRRSEMRTCLNEVSGVYVTITLRVVPPFDRLVKTRDDMEQRANVIRALIHKDSWDNRISRAANVLANYDTPVTAIGFREALWFTDMGKIETKGGDWFHADPEAREVGLVQTLRFYGSRRIQATVTETD